MPDSPIWLTEAEVVSFMDLGEAITAIRDGLSAPASDAASSMGKAQTNSNGVTLQVTGAINTGSGYVCTKAWAHTKTGATPIVLLWASDDGRLLAVIEAFALGQYRTAAVSAIAADTLAPQSAAELAVCGTGAQALMQVAAVNAVRHLRTVCVWSPTPASRARFKTEVRDALGLDAYVAASPDEAVAGADIVVLVTRATAPFLRSGFVRRGSHVNAVGAVGPDRAEFDADLLDRCDQIVVDDIVGAKAWSRELRQHFGGEAEADWSRVTRLADLVAADYQRPTEADVTLFKGMGLGQADLSVAQAVYERAVANGLGTPLPIPQRSHPRLRSAIKGGSL